MSKDDAVAAVTSLSRALLDALDHRLQSTAIHNIIAVVQGSEQLKPIADRIAPFLRPENNWTPENIYWGRFIQPILDEYGKRTQSAYNSPEVLQQLVSSYLAEAGKPLNSLHYQAPLFGLRVNGELQVGANLILRQPTPEQRANWDRLITSKGYRLQSDFALLETGYEFPWDVESLPDEEARRGVDDAKLMLAVVAVAAVYEPFALATTNMVPFHESFRVAGSEMAMPFPEKVVGPENQTDFDALAHGLAGSNKKAVRFAMRRFATSMQRTSLADRLVDSWIILESIFSDSNTELAHKVSFRIAASQASNGEEASALFLFLKKSYSARSKMVHGDEDGFTSTDVQRVNEVARTSILRLAMEPGKFDPTEIDRRALFASSQQPSPQMANKDEA